MSIAIAFKNKYDGMIMRQIEEYVILLRDILESKGCAVSAEGVIFERISGNIIHRDIRELASYGVTNKLYAPQVISRLFGD